jgi:parvulin-like peptidyl-prolyl isomerase
MTVGLGVVLVAYRGAENAPPSARTKEAALARAKELVGDAMKDFAEAVKKGDRGSVDDVGTMPRGVLDPAVEYALFTLKKGDVYREPLDTPRGYWIIRRLR